MGKNEENIRTIVKYLTATWKKSHPGSDQEAIWDLKIFSTETEDWILSQKLKNEKSKDRAEQAQLPDDGFAGVNVEEFNQQKGRHTKGAKFIAAVSILFAIWAIWRICILMLP